MMRWSKHRSGHLRRVLALALLAALSLLGAGCQGAQREEETYDEKPVIYLYPEEETQVEVSLALEGELTASYPDYGGGWRVLARPAGTLPDPATGREYYCLFWEGESGADYDLSEGFVVAGEDTADFLERTLSRLGLSDREANEFILYWLPRMEGNPYNLISFQTRAYTDAAVLRVEPQPDTVIRVFMAWKPLPAPVEAAPQHLPQGPERRGFTLVEWGGAQLA